MASSGATGGVSHGHLSPRSIAGRAPATIRAAVIENRAPRGRRRWRRTPSLSRSDQIHSAEPSHVAARRGTSAKGRRPMRWSTDMPGIALGILTADCAPVLFADPQARRDRRRPCRLERRARRRARSGARGDGDAGRAARRESPPPSVPASARRITKWARNSATASSTPTPATRASSSRRPGGAFPLRSGGLCRRTAGRRGLATMSSALAACTYAREADFFSFRRTTHRGEPDYGRQFRRSC